MTEHICSRNYFRKCFDLCYNGTLSSSMNSKGFSVSERFFTQGVTDSVSKTLKGIWDLARTLLSIEIFLNVVQQVIKMSMGDIRQN